MNLFNKFTACFTAAALVVTTLVPVLAATDADYTEDSAYPYGAAMWAINNGVTANSTVSTAAPFANITREQFAAIAVRGFDAIGLDLTADEDLNCEYNDFSSASAGLQEFVTDACQKGLFQDADDAANGNFNPKATVSEAVVAMIFCKALYGADECSADAGSARYSTANDVLVQEGVMMSAKSDAKMATRGVVFQMFKNVSEMDFDVNPVDEDPTLPGTTGTTNTGTNPTVVNPTSKGSLNVKVSAESPAGKSIPSKGNNIKVLTLELTAGADDVVVNGLTISKYGYTNSTSVKEVYLRNANDVIVTNLRALNNDGTASLTIKGGLTIKNGSTEKLQLFMNVDGVGAEQYQFAVNSVSSLTSNAREVVGSFPIIGNAFQSISYQSQTVRFTALSGSNSDITVGDMNTEVAKFQLDVVATGANRNDVVVRTITLKNTRTIADNLDKLVLKTSSETVSTSVVVTDKFVTFTLKPDYFIEDGQSRTFYIYADVVGGELNDTVQFSLDNTSDIYAYEREGNQASAFVDTLGTTLRGYNVKEGDNLITKASDSPSTSYVDQDSSKTLVLIANVNFKSKVNVEKMNVTVSDVDNVVDTLAVYANAPMNDPTAVKLDEVTVGAGGLSISKELSVYRDLQGLTKLYFYVETESTATDAKNFTVSINNNSFPSAEYVNSNNTIAASDINGSATSSVMTTKTAVLNTLSRTDGFSSSSETVVAGDKVYLGEFSISHNNVRDVKVTSITVSLSGNNTGNPGQYVNNLTLSGESMEVVKSVTSSFSAPVVFNSLSLMVPKNTTKKFKLYGNINTSYTGNLQLAVAISDAESIKADGSTNQFASSALTSKQTAPFLVEAGAVFTVAKISDSTPATSVIVADTESSVARYDFRVSKDSATVQELAFTGTAGAYNAGVEFAVYALNATTPSSSRQSLVQSGSTYYVSFNGLSLPLGKDVDTSYVVKSRTSSNIDSTSKTNVAVAVTLVQSVAGTTAKTKIISNANSSEITAGAFAISTTAKTSKTQYLRRTNLVASNFTANTASAKVTLGTNNGSNASIAMLPLEFNLAGISGIVIDRVEVAGVEKDIASVATVTANGVTVLEFVDPVDVSAAGTTVEVFYTVTINASAQTVSAKVRIPQGANTDFSMDDANTFGTPADSLVWSDKADANTTLTNGNWFSSAKIGGLPTAYATIQ